MASIDSTRGWPTEKTGANQSSDDAPVLAAKSASDISASSKEPEIVDEDARPSHKRDLPRRTDSLTLPIIIVLVAGGLERAGFYAVTTPWRM